MFIHPHNHDERGKSFLRTFDQARREASLPRLTSHTLRHYFISQCVMSGIPFFTIARWVGHRNTKMIEETYGHLTPDYQAAQMKKLKILPTGGGAGQTLSRPDSAQSCSTELVPPVFRNLPENLPAALAAEIGKVVTRYLAVT